MISLILGQSEAPARENTDGLKWQLDRHELTYGGCVSMLIQNPGNHIRNDLEVQVGDHLPLPLNKCTGQIRSDQHTVYLLWVNTREASGPGTRGAFVQLRPLFDKEGTVTISLTRKGELIGQEQVIVRPLPPECGGALELLFPGAPRFGAEILPQVAWPLFFADEEWRLPVRRRSESILVRGKETLPIVMQHPDWAEVAPAVLLHRELQWALWDTIQEGLRRRFAARESRQGEEAGSIESIAFDDLTADEDAQAVRQLAQLGCDIGHPQYTNRFAQAVAEESDILLRRWESGVLGWKPRVTRDTLIAEGYQSKFILPRTSIPGSSEGSSLSQPLATRPAFEMHEFEISSSSRPASQPSTTTGPAE